MSDPLPKIELAVSSCLLGEKVRYDGGDKKLDILNDELSQFFNFISICPEVLMGLGTPRAPVYVLKENSALSLKFRGSNEDLTANAKKTYENTIRTKLTQVKGYILKSRSPSCALRELEFVSGSLETQGLFAHYFRREFPHLVYVEEIDLTSAKGVLSFCVKIFLKAGLIMPKAEVGALFKDECDLNSPAFYEASNLLISTSLPKNLGLEALSSLADRLSS